MSLVRKMFGPSQKEIWQQLAQEIDGKVFDGGWWNQSKVTARTGEWTITLDQYTVMAGKVPMIFTRFRAPYVNRDGFRFKVYRKTLFTGLGKMMGLQDIEIGDPEFDDAFVLQGNNEAQVIALFKNPKIRTLLHAQPDVSFEVRDDEGWFGAEFPEGVDELHFLFSGDCKDVERLKGVYALFAEVLQQLCEIGSAYEHAPQVSL